MTIGNENSLFDNMLESQIYVNLASGSLQEWNNVVFCVRYAENTQVSGTGTLYGLLFSSAKDVEGVRFLKS